MEISTNVFWLGGRPSNFYLCRDDDGLTLIDSGAPGREELVFEALSNMDYRPADLVRILITHADFDHAGSAAAIQEETSAAVIAGAETAEYLRCGKSPKHLPRLVQLFADRFFTYAPVSKAMIRICHDGDALPVLGGLHVLATPGHTLDHYSFYSPTEGVLFAGDALRTEGGRLRASRSFITADEDAARRSAIKLLNLAPAVFACGHGPPMSHHSSDDLMALLNDLRHS